MFPGTGMRNAGTAGDFLRPGFILLFIIWPFLLAAALERSSLVQVQVQVLVLHGCSLVNPLH